MPHRGTTGNIVERKREWIIRAASRGAPASTDGHTDHVLALAVTSDGKFLVRRRHTDVRATRTHRESSAHLKQPPRASPRLPRRQASAGRDTVVRIWDTAQGTHVHAFRQHRGAVTVCVPYRVASRCRGAPPPGRASFRMIRSAWWIAHVVEIGGRDAWTGARVPPRHIPAVFSIG